MTRTFAVLGVLGAAYITIQGRAGAIWFFIAAMLAAAVCDVTERALRELRGAKVKELEQLRAESDARNEIIAKELAALHGEFAGDIRDLKRTLVELSQRQGFSDLP